MLAESEDFVLFSGASRTICGTPQRSHTRVIHWLRPLCFVICLGVSSLLTLTVCAQEIKPISSATVEAEHSAAASTTEEHQLSQKAVEIGRVFGFPITNSMLVTWIVALGLIAFAQIATRRMQMVPTGAQNFLEWLVESLHGFLKSLLGEHLVERTFWFFATVFIFILTSNWVGLIPGVGTVGWGHQTARGFRIDQPLFRGANADVNMTLAMALVFFASGLLEVISILFRPVSLSFRLYGNIFAGENMLETMAGLVPSLSWLIPIPFYFLELLVGFVQALVFMLLTAVFTLLLCQHEEREPEAAHS